MLDALYDRPDFLLPLVGWSMIGIVVLAIAGMRTWRKYQEARLETELKLELLASGKSADEIERILAAKMSGRN